MSTDKIGGGLSQSGGNYCSEQYINPDDGRSVKKGFAHTVFLLNKETNRHRNQWIHARRKASSQTNAQGNQEESQNGLFFFFGFSCGYSFLIGRNRIRRNDNRSRNFFLRRVNNGWSNGIGNGGNRFLLLLSSFFIFFRNRITYFVFAFFFTVASVVAPVFASILNAPFTGTHCPVTSEQTCPSY